MTRIRRFSFDRLPVTGWLAFAALLGIALVVLLRGSFRPFGFLMDTLLLLVAVLSVLYVWMLYRRPGHGPATENLDDVLAVAEAELERGEISAEEYARIRGNTED